jgi:hypothetical protein
MAKKQKRTVKDKQGTRLPLFLAVSLAVHSAAAVAVPALVDFYADKPVSVQSLAYVDVVHENNLAQARPDKAAAARHAPAVKKAPPKVTPPPEAASKPKDIPEPTASSKEIAAPENAPDSDISSAAAHAKGPIKPSGGGTLVASLEKNISAPAISYGIAGSGPVSPGDGAMHAGEKVEGDTDVAAAGAGGAGDADDIVGVGDIKSYSGGDPVISSSEKGAAGFSTYTGAGPQFSPAGLNIAGAAGTPEADAGDSESAAGITTAKLEKAAGTAQAGRGALGEAVTGSARGGGSIETGGKKMASAGTLYASIAGVPGGTPGGAGEKDAGVEAIKTGTYQAAGFGHAGLQAVPETGIAINSPSDGSVIDCMESADITVAGEVRGNVDKVKVYINGVYYETRPANGYFKIKIPARAQKNFIYAEGYDIYGDRSVSEHVTCMVKNLNPVDMAVYLDSGDGHKLRLKYVWRPYPLKGKGGEERDDEFHVSGDDNQEVLTVAHGARGIYIIGIENPTKELLQANLRICVFPRDPHKKRERKMAMTVVGGAEAGKLVRILLPEGVFWDDDKWFSGELESTRDSVKFKQPEGIAWKEDK